MQQSDQIYGVYIKSILSTKLTVHITEVGKNIKQILEDALNNRVAGKCINEGYIMPKSIRIMTYSSGAVNLDNVEFNVVYECSISSPVEGMLIECRVKTVTKAGIHAQVIDTAGNIPITIFIARDHHQINTYFQSIKEIDNIVVRVIGSRYELYDPYICVIAELVNMKSLNTGKPPRKMGGDKLIISDEN